MCAAEAEQLLSPFDISDLRCGVYHNVFSDYRIKILYKLLFFVSSSIKIIDKIEKTKVVRPSGPHRNVSKVSGRETEAVKVPAKRSRMPRRGCHRKVTGGGKTGFLPEILWIPAIKAKVLNIN